MARKLTLSLRESCSVVHRVPYLLSTLVSLSDQAHSEVKNIENNVTYLPFTDLFATAIAKKKKSIKCCRVSLALI